MLLRLAVVAILAVFCAPALSAQSPVTRGHYYRCDEPAFEMWIPGGFTVHALLEQDKERRDEMKARFRGTPPGLNQLAVQIYEAALTDLDLFLKRLDTATREGCEGATHEVKARFEAGPFPAAITLTSNYANADERHHGLVRVIGALQFDEVTTIQLTGYAEAADSVLALEQMRWMLATARRPGEAGLDPFLARRRVDTETGLSYRPPRGLTAAAPSEGASFLYRGEGGKPARTVTISPAAGRDLGAVVKAFGRGKVALGGRRLFPHEPGVDAEVFGGLYRADDKSRAFAVLAVRLGKEHMYRVVAEGPLAARDKLLRTAELTAMGFRHVDVGAARKEVADAQGALEAAKQARDGAAVGAAVAVLVKHPYLEGVPAALAGALRYLPDPAAIGAAVTALASHGSTAQLPEVLDAVRYYRAKHEAPALAALVPVLATLRGKRAATMLFALARRPEVEPAAAAVRALGHYREPPYHAAKKLVSLMIRAEKAGHSTKVEERERWKILQPIYVEALKRLTGQTFATAAEARAWLRK
jgi:hypothetical protein